MQKKTNLSKQSACSARSESEVSRILTAAVVNRRFCEMLLSNPERAISGGFGGEVFSLGREEKTRLSAIRATSLADFARQVTQNRVVRMGLAAD